MILNDILLLLLSGHVANSWKDDLLATGLDRDIAFRDLSKSYDPEKTESPRYECEQIARSGRITTP